MISSQNACAVHIALLNIISILANLSMIIHVWKTRNNTKKTDLIFVALGMSNFAVSAFFTFRSLLTSLVTLNDTHISPIEALLYGFYGVISSQNLLLNVGIAYSRFCAVSQPMMYCKEKERSRLQKKIVLVITVISNLLGLATGLVLGITRSRVVRNGIETATRFVTYTLLCIIYLKIFCKVKTHNKIVAVAIGVGNEDESNITQQRAVQHEKYLTKLFIGITVSFLISNLPIMIITTIIPSLQDCETVQGRLLIFAATFVIIGMIFDPFWYFLLWRRIKKRQSARANP